MLVSLVLYGSRARGDHRLSSDVDLLGVVENGPIRKEVVSRGASLYRYPAQTLLAKAKEGDLFLLHLVSEGKVLHDSLDFFERVKKAFVYNKTYEPVIQQGHAIARFIESHPSLLQSKKVRKRYIWALRTILIGRCAEKQVARFSSTALAEFSASADLKRIIDGRNTVSATKMISVGTEIVTQFGCAGVDEAWPTDKSLQNRYLESLGGIAESTLGLSRIVRNRPPPSVLEEIYE